MIVNFQFRFRMELKNHGSNLNIWFDGCLEKRRIIWILHRDSKIVGCYGRNDYKNNKLLYVTGMKLRIRDDS